MEGLFYSKITLDYNFKPNSAVLKRKCRAEDGLTYAVKTNNKPGDYTPVNEYICASIAKKIGIPIPDFKILLDCKDNTLWFASKWETGLVSPAENYKMVEDKSIFSAILAFDFLILNNDRHFNNYLIQIVDDNYKLLAFDHSHALFYNSKLKENEMMFFPDINSRTVLYILTALNIKIDSDKIKTVLEKFTNIKPDFFDIIIQDCIEAQWLNFDMAERFKKWLKERSSCTEKIYGNLRRYDYDPVSILSGLDNT